MTYRQALLVITLASGLGACATSPDYGLRYEDGSYYSPAGEGRGDYYVGAEPQRSYYYYDDFDLFFGSSYYGWYGSPFYSHGGYCSARYRYCPRWAWGGGFPDSGFDIYFGSPWDPYWGRGHYPSQPYRDIHRRPAPRPSPWPAVGNDGNGRDPDWRQDQRPAQAPRPRPRPAPDLREDSGDSPFPAPRSGRRSPFPRAVERAPSPAPAPPPKTDGGDGN